MEKKEKTGSAVAKNETTKELLLRARKFNELFENTFDIFFYCEQY